jgi:hypothetical protein
MGVSGLGKRLCLIDGLHLHAWVERRDMSRVARVSVHGARLDLRQGHGDIDS